MCGTAGSAEGRVAGVSPAAGPSVPVRLPALRHTRAAEPAGAEVSCLRGPAAPRCWGTLGVLQDRTPSRRSVVCFYPEGNSVWKSQP